MEEKENSVLKENDKTNNSILAQAQSNLKEDNAEYERAKKLNNSQLRELERRGDARSAGENYDKDFRQGENNSVETYSVDFFKILFKRLFSGAKTALFERWKDDDIILGDDRLHSGNTDAQYEDSKVIHNLSNELTEDISLGQGQGMSKDITDKVKKQASDEIEVNPEQVKVADLAIKPQEGRKFLVSDYENFSLSKDGSLEVDNKTSSESVTFNGEKLDGTNKYVFDVDDATAKKISDLNQTQATGIRVSSNLDNDIPTNSRDAQKSIKSKQEESLSKKAEQKKQLEKKHIQQNTNAPKLSR